MNDEQRKVAKYLSANAVGYSNRKTSTDELQRRANGMIRRKDALRTNRDKKQYG
jgi:hypothetical protein